MSLTDITNIATVVALVLAIGQTLLAHRQTKDLSFISDTARRQMEELPSISDTARRQTDELSFISNALSTKYLGSFPEYLTQLNSLVENTKRDLLILSTIPSHGVFSDHEEWFKRKQALEDALHRKVKVNCVFANASKREEHRRNQFRDALANWSAWRSNPVNAARLQQIVDRFGDGGSIQELTSDQFLNLLETASIQELERTYKGAAIITQIHFRPPLYMWIADGKEAIFAFWTTRPNHAAQAFWTTDVRLIDALAKIHQEYCSA